MRIATDEEPADGRPDYCDCPICGKCIIELADDVSDADFRDDGGRFEDVASVQCPACGGAIALVREHLYRLTTFAANEEEP